MAWFVRVSELATKDMQPTGRFRLTATSDEDGGGPHGDTSHDHGSRAEADGCARCQDYCDRVTGVRTPRPTAREAIARLTVKPARVDPLDLPLLPLVEEAIARYGSGSEPPLTPKGWLDWGEEERAQWVAYQHARWA